MPRAVVWAGLIITLVFLVLALFAPLIAPYGFDQYKTAEGVRFVKQQAPSAAHLFGTNVMSTDVMSRVVFGARTAIEVVLLALAFSLLIGLPLGLVSGYYGGKLDRVLLLFMDALIAFPYLLLAIVILPFVELENPSSESRLGWGVADASSGNAVIGCATNL